MKKFMAIIIIIGVIIAAGIGGLQLMGFYYQVKTVELLEKMVDLKIEMAEMQASIKEDLQTVQSGALEDKLNDLNEKVSAALADFPDIPDEG